MWKIAIIDDDRQAIRGLKSQIPWDELEAECVGESIDGAQGLEMIRDTHPDIIITDIYMPEMSGLEMIQILRQEQYEGKIIILSGYNDFEYARQALRLNVDDYLSKPISLHTLQTLLTKTIHELEEAGHKKWAQSEMQEKLKVYEPFVAKEWLKGVVSGTLDSSYRGPVLRPEQEDKWQDARYVVMGIEIAEILRFSEVTISDRRLFRFAVSNVVQEVVSKFQRVFDYVELYCSHSVLVLYFDRKVPAGELICTLRQLASQIMASVQNVLKVRLRMGIGTFKEQWQHLSDSTEEAFQALAHRKHRSGQPVDLYEYEAAGNDVSEAMPALRLVKYYQQLTEAIKTSQEAQAIETTRDFMMQLQERSEELTPALLQRLGAELWAVLSYALHEAGVVLEELFVEDRIHTDLAIITNPHQLQAWIADKIKVICSHRLCNENAKHKETIDFMIQHIHKHYAEDITLSELSEQVFISRNHLNDIFKKATGETFHSYLTRVRMEKAKRLIVEGRLHIYEIALQVGYKNVPYFSTVFKKYSGGVNPTEWLK